MQDVQYNMIPKKKKIIKRMQMIKNIFLKKYLCTFLFISIIFINIEYLEIDNEFILL